MASHRRVQPGPGWERVLARLERGTVLVVGGPGTGKTPLAGFLAAQLGRALDRTAWIDADPGQAAVGTAGCLGLAMTGPWRAPAAQWFVGDTAARRLPLATVVGAARLAERARREGAEVVILDAPSAGDGAEVGTGAEDGDDGWHLLHHMALAAGVDQVVAVERNGELRPFLDVVAGRTEIHRLPAPAASRPSGGGERAAAAEDRLRAHLAGARTRRFARRRLLDTGWSPSPDPDPGTLVGLLDRDGFCLALGVVEELAEDSVAVRTPWSDRSRVERLQLGDLRLERHQPPEGPGEGWRITSTAHEPPAEASV